MEQKNILNEHDREVDSFITLLRRFNDEVNRLRPIFNSHIDGLDIAFDNVWVRHAASGNLEIAIGEYFVKYLERYPKFHRQAIDECFTKQVSGLYGQLSLLTSIYRMIYQDNGIIPYSALDDHFRFAKDGTIIIDDASVKSLREEISVVADTPEKLEAVEVFESFYRALEVFRQKIGEGAANRFLYSAVAKNLDDLSMEGIRARTKGYIEHKVKITK